MDAGLKMRRVSDSALRMNDEGIEILYQPAAHSGADSSMDGAETMHREFRDKIKDKFVIPLKCKLNCGK